MKKILPGPSLVKTGRSIRHKSPVHMKTKRICITYRNTSQEILLSVLKLHENLDGNKTDVAMDSLHITMTNDS